MGRGSEVAPGNGHALPEDGEERGAGDEDGRRGGDERETVRLGQQQADPRGGADAERDAEERGLVPGQRASVLGAQEGEPREPGGQEQDEPAEDGRSRGDEVQEAGPATARTPSITASAWASVNSG